MKTISPLAFVGFLGTISLSAFLVLVGLLAIGYFNPANSSPKFNLAHVAPPTMEDVTNPKPASPREQFNTEISQCDNEVQLAGYYCFQLCEQNYPNNQQLRDQCKTECARRMAPDV
ncbi:MAG: hypothetical protein AB4062_01445 [Crocosphaera sp.]